MSYLEVSMSRASRAPPQPVPSTTSRCLLAKEDAAGGEGTQQA
jgi:hypothetical protein